MRSLLVLACMACVPPRAGVQPVSSLAEARATHTATLLPDGRVLVAGGFRKGADGYSQIYSPTTEIYDPATHTFRAGRPLRVARGGHTATALADGRVLLAGGWNEAGELDGAELYDPAGGSKSLLVPMAGPRGGHTATLLADGRVLVAGGTAGREAELYDPAAGRFVAAGGLRAPREGHTATLLADGRVLIAGGRQERGDVLRGAELYDPRRGAFEPTGDLGVARYKHDAIRLGDGRVLIVGGSDARDWRGRLASAEVFDPATGRFSPAPELRHARFKLRGALALLPDGRVLVAGGARDLELYAPGGGFSDAGSLDGPRFYGTATLLSDGDVLIAGGYDETPRAFASAWLFHPAR